MELLRILFQKIFGWLWKNKGKVAAAAGSIGVAAGAVGVGAGVKAKKVNKKALAIQEKALADYNSSSSETQIILSELGDLQLSVADSFDDFMNAMERILDRPKGLAEKLAKVKLPDYHPEELKTLSEAARLAIAGGAGAVAGAGVGVAAFGLAGIAVAPAAFAGGVVLCVKGVSLAKKAAKNKREALKMQKEVEKILRYHSTLRNAANTLLESLNAVNRIYIEHLNSLCKLTDENQMWKTYTKEQQLLVKNTILLVNLLNHTCRVTLVVKAKNEDGLESVDEKAVKQVVNEANALLPKLA